MLSLGLVGYSEGNGHPYSFPAIINGFETKLLMSLNYDAIKAYLTPFCGQVPHSYGMRVTEVWSPKSSTAKDIARFARIPRVVPDYRGFSKDLDAVLVLCDVSEIRSETIDHLLSQNIMVFVDKPLSLKATELDGWRGAITNGQLFSWSMFRYAPFLKEVKNLIKLHGEPTEICCNMRGDWEKYSNHLVEPLAKILSNDADEVSGLEKIISSTKILFRHSLEMPQPFLYTFKWHDTVFHWDISNNLPSFLAGMTAIEDMIKRTITPLPVDYYSLLIDIYEQNKI